MERGELLIVRGANGFNWRLLQLLQTSRGNKAPTGLRAEERAKFIISEAMADKRKSIKKKACATGENGAHNVRVARFAKNKARALKKAINKNRTYKKLDRGTLLRRRVPSPILDALDLEREGKWKPIVSRRYKSVFERLALRNLDFVNFPSETLHSIQRLSKINREEVNAFLDFDDDECADIGAFLVIAEIWGQLSPIFRGGRMSLPIQKVLDAVGLRRELKMGLMGRLDRDGIWPFEIRRRRPKGSTISPTAQLRPQDREHLNDALIELMNEWLQVASESAQSIPPGEVWELTSAGKANIANMVGEILDNAERHSVKGGDGDWSMAAFMIKKPRPDGLCSMKCHMAFLSVGRSIAETINDATEEIYNFCDRYAKTHIAASQSWDTLVTIAALQDGVTSSREAASHGRGGTGLQDTLKFVADLAGVPNDAADVQVTIVSGQSCIRLKHPILVGAPDGEGRRVQWCNRENNRELPPDPSVAFDLPAHFAGTLVSIAFTLDPALFVREGEQGGNDDD